MGYTTIHGWPAIEDATDSRLHTFTVPGTTRKVKLRKDVGPYLVAFASRYHQKIAPIDQGTLDDWGWSPLRKGRASSSISDHCAGVALDLNATKEGAQNRTNLTSFWKVPLTWLRLQVLRRRFRLLEWGGDYETFYDPMHWTFKRGVSKGEILAEIARMGIDSEGRL